MNAKVKQCFTPHMYMHNLVGLGLGGLLTSLFSGLQHWWIGAIAIAVAVLWDLKRVMSKP
jgi:hypothetical protein